jgi:hypothetical protein
LVEDPLGIARLEGDLDSGVDPTHGLVVIVGGGVGIAGGVVQPYVLAAFGPEPLVQRVRLVSPASISSSAMFARGCGALR